MKQHGPWQIVQSNEVYRDPWITLRKDDVIRPDGQPGTFSVVHLKPGVCVLPLGNDVVYLTEEFHYGVGRTTIEAVSGGIEPGETTLVTAQREMLEELGIRAADWLDLGVCDPFTSSVVSPTQLFLARGLEIGEQAPEGTERIRRLEVPFSEAVAMVMDGRITHGSSCVLILKVQMLLTAER
jgi:ADP-ribose pyrophosphatase